MFYPVGNLLSPLYPFIALFSALFADTEDDKPDNSDQKSDDESGQPGEQGDDDDSDDDDEDDDSDDTDDSSDEEDDDDSEDDDIDADLDQEEINSRHADTAISKSNEQRDASLKSLVKTMVKYPDSAEETINDLRESSPKLAERLAKMYEKQSTTTLKDALKDAPEGVRDLLSKLVDDVGALNKRSEQDEERANQEQIREERRLYKSWEGASHPYLDPKSEEAQTPLGKKLVKEFRRAVNRLPSDEPVTEELLEDALAIAVRRSGWDTSRVSESVKKQAKEQAQKARSGAIGNGKSRKGAKADSNPSKSRVTADWPNQSDDRQAKVDEVKAKRFPNLR